MISENILWAPIVLKVVALLFLAFLVLLIFKTIQRQQHLNEMSAQVEMAGVRIATNMFPILVAILAGVAALWVAFSGGITSIEVSEPISRTMVQDEQVQEYQKRIEALESRFKTLQQATADAGAIENGTEAKRLLALVAESKTISEENSKSIKSFESLILSDAEKLLTLPLLKRDLGSIGSEIKSLKSEVSTLRSLMAESSNQNRWLIGTLALGMLALVLPAIRSMMAGEKEEKKGSAPSKKGAIGIGTAIADRPSQSG
jgi:archaellin